MAHGDLQLPSSIGPAMMAVQAVALALAVVAPQMRAAGGAQKSVQRLQTTAVRALGEFKLFVETGQQAQQISAILEDETKAQVDRIAEARAIAYACKESFERATRAKNDVQAALKEARKFDQMLSYWRRDWKNVAEDMQRAFDEVDEQLAEVNFARILDESLAMVDGVFAQAHRLIANGDLPMHDEHPEAREVAAEGYSTWFASLPEDDWSDAVDSGQVTPLRWVDDEGWVGH